MPQEKVYRFLVMMAATAIVVVVLRMASGIIAPMMMALFLTIVLVIPMRWLQSKGCPEILSLIFVLVCTGAVFFGIGRVVVSSLNEFGRKFPEYKVSIENKVEAIDRQVRKLGYTFWQQKAEETDDQEEDPSDTSDKESVPKISTEMQPKTPSEPSSVTVKQNHSPEPVIEPIQQTKSVDEHSPPPSTEGGGEVVPEENISDGIPFLEEGVTTDLTELITGRSLYHRQRVPRQSLTELNTGTFMFWVGKAVMELQQLAKTGFLVMIITIFMLFEARRFPEKVDWALGKTGPINNEQLHHIAREIRRYLFIKTLSCMLSAITATIVYLCFGVDGALFWGLVAFFLYYIPNLGGIMAAIIPGLLIFTTHDLDGLLLYVVVLATTECILGYVVEPKMLGHGLGMATVVIILSLLVWGWIFGPIGLFLAAPLTIMVKIILQASKETEWIAILLGDKYQPTKPEK